MSRAFRRAAAPLALLLALGACSGDGDGAPPSGSPSPSATRTSGASQTGTPPGGTADAPAVVTPTVDLLDWSAVPGSVDRTVTVSGPWTLTVDEQGRRARLSGPAPVTVTAGSRNRISDALIDRDFAVVVSQDRLERRPATATVVELATGHRFVLDGTSEVPTTTGGTWALGEGHVLHATTQDAGAMVRYCLASVDLASETSQVAWCAEPRHGFTNARITADGDSLLTFDDSQPSCRTVGSLAGGDLTPFPGVTECKGWDGALLTDGRIWSVVPRDDHIDAAHYYAAIGEGFFDLGPGTSGSLVTCAGAAYFSRDPGREGDPAQVLRWTPDGRLAVVYEAPAAGEGFITVPLRCGDDTLTVTALTEGGDEQVSAALG